MSTVSILDVAEEVVTLETCIPQDARFIEDVEQDRDRNPFIGWESSAVTPRLVRLRDVVLDRTLMVLLKHGRVIAETNYLQSPEAIAALTVREQDLAVLDLGFAVTGCFDHWHANYYHWVAHTLPTVHAVMQRRPSGDCGLIVPRMAPWQRASLDLLGASALPTIATEPGERYFLPELEYYDFVAGSADFAISPLSRAAYEAMAAPPADDAPRPLIYIDRGGSANRRLPNEPALVEQLRGRGFHIVRPETLDLRSQIALFRQAGMVVGQLGAGLANIAFCRPGTIVYELIPEHHKNPCFLAMAMQGDLRYWADVFPTGVEGDDHTSPWRVPIDVGQVLRRIDELAALMRPPR